MNQKQDQPSPKAAPEEPELPDEAPAGQAEQDNQAPADELAAAKALAEGLKDRLLRQMAEMENLRKRTERDKTEATRYAIARFARDIVTVADDLHRALASVPEDAKKDIEAVRNLVDGVAVTERQLMQIFERHGLKRFDPIGERFNPERHEAMFELPDPTQPAGTVAQVIEAGYMIGERMLRPARVGVARGGPKLEPARTEDKPDPDPAAPAADEPAQAKAPDEPPDAPAAPAREEARPPQPEPGSTAEIGKKIDTSA